MNVGPGFSYSVIHGLLVHLLSCHTAHSWEGGTEGHPAKDLYTAILMTVSSKRRPSEEIGGASSQYPDSLQNDANRRARFCESWAESNKSSLQESTLGLSQDFCLTVSVPKGGEWLWPVDQSFKAKSTKLQAKKDGIRW